MPSSKDLVYLVNGVLVDFAGRRLNLQNIGLLGPIYLWGALVLGLVYFLSGFL